MRWILKTTLVPLIGLLILVLGPSPAPAFEKGVIHIGTATAMTGPWAAVGTWQMRGATDRIKYQNEKLGGICGHRIDHLWCDMKCDVKTGIAAYHRFATTKPKPVAISVGHGTVTHALKDAHKKDQILDVAWMAIAGHIIPPGWIYWVVPGYADSTVAFGKWLQDNWDYKTKGVPRVACIGQEHPRTYEEWIGYKYCEDQGWLKRVAFEVYPLGVTDVKAEMKRIAAQKPNFIISVMNHSTFGVVMEEADRLGLLDTAKIVVGTYDLGRPYMLLAGDRAKGVLGLSLFAFPDETNLPGVRLIREVHNKYHGTPVLEDNMSYFFGWIINDVIIEATRRAIEKVGYEHLTGLAVKEALESIKDYDTGGLTHPLTYGKGTEGRRGNKYCRLAEWDGVNWKSVTPWYEVPFIYKK